MTENVEKYTDLSAEEIFKILKQKIEGFKEFKIMFEDSTAELSIHIDYDFKKNRYELNVVKLVNLEVVDSEYGFINVPDNAIVGTGHLYTTDTGGKIISIGSSGTSIKVFRYFKTLYITGFKQENR